MAATPNYRNKKVIFTNCAPFTEINNTQVDNAKDIDVVMPMYNLIENSGIYWKTPGNLWKYDRDKPSVDNNNSVVDLPANINCSILFKFKEILTEQSNNNDIKNVEIILPLKYLSNFWRTLEMPLTNWEIHFILTWSGNSFLSMVLWQINCLYLQ